LAIVTPKRSANQSISPADKEGTGVGGRAEKKTEINTKNLCWI